MFQELEASVSSHSEKPHKTHKSNFYRGNTVISRKVELCLSGSV